MASLALISFRSSPIIASSTPASRGRRSGGSGGGGNWWTPLFGWPSEPDYVEAATRPPAGEGEEQRQRPRKFAALTEEKARELRMRTKEMDSFHDVMYHSAIASRLASDLNRRSEK